MVTRSIDNYAPSQDVVAMGLSKDQLDTILKNFAATLVLDQAAQEATAPGSNAWSHLEFSTLLCKFYVKSG